MGVTKKKTVAVPVVDPATAPAPAQAPAQIEVEFEVPAALGASTASVAGDFNGWSTDATPMTPRGDGTFVATVALPVGRSYQFRYFIDGDRWENDWNADAYAPNDFGGDDSVVDLTLGSARLLTGPSAASASSDAAFDEIGEGATVTEVLAAYARGGFAASFSVEAGGRMHCDACGESSSAADAKMSSLRRLEGESDPSDMVAVVALTCPVCGTKGAVVLGFGPMSSVEDADVLTVVRDHRGDHHAPGNSAPGETAGDAPAEV